MPKMMPSDRTAPKCRALFIVCLVGLHVARTDCFAPPAHGSTPTKRKRQCQSTCCFAAPLNSNNNDDNDGYNLDELDTSNLERNGPEKSQMYDYISQFLQKENGESPQSRNKEANSNSQASGENEGNEYENFTHLIAIPMGDCHEVGIELESVQRAILYHCPVLVHACLVPAIMRLPLLYVHASQSTTKEATETLNRIVEELVQKHMYVPSETYIEEVDEDGEVALDGTNEDGYRPLILTFQSLEIDGSNNQVLNTVALPDDPGTRRLQTMVMELQQEIATRLNWKTSLPPDEHIVPGGGTSEQHEPSVFRPRLPFMRIPPNFENYLDPLPGGSDEDEAFRTSDEGGNGISPIFWCSWWDDDFGKARCREIAIYPRTQSGNALSENSFYIPNQMTDLPEGNAALTKQEAKFESYQEQRVKQAEYDIQRDMEEERSLAESSNAMDEDDIMLERTRSRLESLYQQGSDSEDSSTNDKSVQERIIEGQENSDRPKVDTSILDEWTQERIRKANEARGITMYDDEDEDDNVVENAPEGRETKTTEDNYVTPSYTQSSSSSSQEDEDTKAPKVDESNNNSDGLDESTRKRIQDVVDSRQAVQSRRQLASPKDKIPIGENPVFQRFKDGTLVPESKKRDEYEAPKLPPFPSREHFVGFWQVFSSPTGFPPDDDGGDGSKSENLVLRVDGTTAGGPVLDPETNQKAAGGTWKVIEHNEDSAKLRIRLVIPPKKERILVMEGSATKGSMVSLKDLPPLAGSTFGIPALEEKIKKAKEADESTTLEEEMVYCNGKVWLEDAITKKNKMDIGTFSLMKLNTPKDPSQYTITVPKPIRNQD